MPESKNQHPLHPAADVFLDQLLLEVKGENKKMEEDIGRLDSSCDFLGRVELHLGSGRIISAALHQSFVVLNLNGLPCVCIDIDDSPCVLTEFRTGRVTMSGQDIGVLPGVTSPIVRITVDGKIRLKIIFSPLSVIEGELCGLSNDDIARFKDNTYGDDEVMQFLMTGQGFQNPNAVTFAPNTICMIVTDELHETIQVLGPLPKFENVDEICCCDPLPMDPDDCIECPPPSSYDESRRANVAALDCTDSHMSLLKENRVLKKFSHRLSKIEERIGAVEIYNAVENTSVSLKDGVLSEGRDGSPMWRITLRKSGKRCPIVANSMNLLEIDVSGVRSELNRLEIHVLTEHERQYFTATFCNGALMVGYLDSTSAPDLNVDDFDEMARGFLSGESQFPPEFTFVAGYVYFPLSSVQNALDVLGVNVDGEVCTQKILL